MVATVFPANVVALSVLIYRQAFTSNTDLWLIVPYLVFIFVLYLRAHRLKRRTAELVIAAAERCGLQRVLGAKSQPRGAP